MNLFGGSSNLSKAAVLENESRIETLESEVQEINSTTDELLNRARKIRDEIEHLRAEGKSVVTEKTSRERVDAMLRELFSDEDRVALIKMARKIYGYLNQHSYEFGPLLQLVFKYHICYCGQDVPRDPRTMRTT